MGNARRTLRKNKRRYYRVEQLTKSQLLYMKNIPDFGLYLLLTITIFLCIVFSWSTRAVKVSIIKANGFVESINKNYIMPPFSGEITENFMHEGMVVEEGDTLFKIKSVDFNLQKNQLLGEKKEYEKKIELLNKLEESIKSDTNLFSITNAEESLYYNQYEAYRSRIDQNRISMDMMEEYGYTEEQIENEIIRNQGVVSEIYYSTLMSIEGTISDYQSQINSINLSLDAVNEGLTEYIVTANESGIIHLLAECKVGMVVQASTTVASIASKTDEYIIKANVTPMDFTRLELNDRAEIEIQGLIPSVYGTISGKIYQIDSDITLVQSNTGQNNSYFSIYIRPDTYYLINKEGKKVNLSNGMEVIANIQYDEITYFDYFLECFGVTKE